MNYVFFKSSQLAFQRVTDIYDFVWPTAVAMWNMREQVEDLITKNKDATESDLQTRFVLKTDIHGANITRAFLEHSWEQQQEYFAKFLLVNLIAFYEAWTEDILEAIGHNTKTLRDQLQYPTGAKLIDVKKNLNRHPNKGIWNVVNSITSHESVMLRDAFYSSLISHEKNSKAQLDSLLYCYRYFKECRNSIIHGGGKANIYAEIAYNDFSKHATSSQLGVKEVPEHLPVYNSGIITLSLRGVVGLSDIIRRIIITIDAELSRSLGAEEEFRQRWVAKHGTKRTLKVVDRNIRQRQIAKMVQSIGFPRPMLTEEIDKFIKNHSLAR